MMLSGRHILIARGRSRDILIARGRSRHTLILIQTERSGYTLIEIGRSRHTMILIESARSRNSNRLIQTRGWDMSIDRRRNIKIERRNNRLI